MLGQASADIPFTPGMISEHFFETSIARYSQRKQIAIGQYIRKYICLIFYDCHTYAVYTKKAVA